MGCEKRMLPSTFVPTRLGPFVFFLIFMLKKKETSFYYKSNQGIWVFELTMGKI